MPGHEVQLRHLAAVTGYTGSATDTTGWTFKTPQLGAVDPGGGAAVITTQTRYAPATGDVAEQRQPSAAGSPTSPGTRASVYFTGGTENLPGCVSWRLRGLVCHVSPAGQADRGASNPQPRC